MQYIEQNQTYLSYKPCFIIKEIIIVYMYIGKICINDARYKFFMKCSKNLCFLLRCGKWAQYLYRGKKI